MLRVATLVVVLAAALAAGPAGAQNFAPAPARPRASPTANICNTEWGWCPLGAVLMPGTPCRCVTRPESALAGTVLPGFASYWPYEGPVNPYLNPHVAPPSTIR
jgi:hypothetical protein